MTREAAEREWARTAVEEANGAEMEAWLDRLRARHASRRVISGHCRFAVTDGMADRTPNLRAS
jgi:hypothetical protein